MPKRVRQVGLYGVITTTLAVVFGVVALWLATCPRHFAALVALALSVAWGTTSAISIISAFNVRRVQAEMRRDAVDKVICELVRQLKCKKKSASERAELIDRLNALATTALAKP